MKKILQSIGLFLLGILVSIVVLGQEKPDAGYGIEKYADEIKGINNLFAYVNLKKETADEQECEIIRVFIDPLNKADKVLDELHVGDTLYQQYADIEDLGEEDCWPEALIQYLTDALQTDSLVEKLRKIPAEQEIIDEEEKEELAKNDAKYGISGYAPYFDEEDTWYRVSLSEDGDDIVVSRNRGEGYILNYYFWNVGGAGQYAETPFISGGQRKNDPYFITWDGINYIAVPCWNKMEDRIIGVAVYEYYHYPNGYALGIGINTDGTINVDKRACYISSGTSSSYVAKGWSSGPVIIRN